MRRAVLLPLCLFLASFACEKPPTSNAPEPEAAAADTGAEASSESTDESAAWAERTAQAEAKAEHVAARWTPQLEAELTAVVDAEYESSAEALEAVLASDHRAPGRAERDVHRRPLETLAFFGIEPGMKVFELGQGDGWYTEILAPYLAKSGTLYLAGPNLEDDSPSGRYGQRTTELFLSAPGNLYAAIELVEQARSPDAPINYGPEGSLDAVLVVRMLHNIHRFEMWERAMPSAFTALAPGGVLAVVQHRAPEGANPDESAAQGYLPEAWLIEKIESYGFELAEKSELNANPKDTKDYEGGVWTLPPSLAKGEEERARYLEIGESDRSTLRFIKPR